MKKKLKSILAVILYIIIPITFGGVGAGVFFWILKPPIEAADILEKGIETTATIIDIKSNVTVSSSSGTTKKKEKFYYLKLIFVNSEGEKIEYKTRSIYPERFIREHNIKEGRVIQAVYVDDKAVIKDFVPEYEILLWIIPIIFGSIGAGFLIFPAVMFLFIALDNIIKRYGVPTIGRYLATNNLSNSDESRFNSITCTIIKGNGDTIEVKTRFIYTNSEAEKLAKMRSFPIMYKWKRAVIMIGNNNNER